MRKTKIEAPSNWARMQQQLLREANACMERDDSASVNLGVYKHGIIEPVLRHLAYDTELKGKSLKSIFEDGSQPTPFPCGQLSNRHLSRESKFDDAYPCVFNLGLMSLRHPEMDYLVDFHIVRNRDVYDQDSSAEVEEFVFQESIKLLSDPWLDGGGFLNLYHTGLEPVVVGFYRGLVTTQLWRDQKRNPNPLVVQPCIYVGYDESKEFSPESPGANPDNYFQPQIWW